jgi:glycosyl-4,4'-diaponeurosporenoate acyltransferase
VLIELSIPVVIVLNITAWAVIQLGLAWAFTQMDASRFNEGGFLARTRNWERKGRVYERLFGIKRWKEMLPDGASWFSGGVTKARLQGKSADVLGQFAKETWRGELVHWFALLMLPLFCLWNPWWAVLVNAAYAVGANLPCILAQRYNRARLHRVLSRKAGQS